MRKLQYVNIFVENQPVTALIDSGCQIPVLNSSLIRVQAPSEEIITLSSCFGEQRMVEVKPINISLNQQSPSLSVRTAISPTLTEEFIIHPSVYSEIEKLGHAKSDVLLSESGSSLSADLGVQFNSSVPFPNVSVSNVIENSSYDLSHVKNFNTRNDSSSLIKDYKSNGAMKTSSVEFISRSPNPLPMKSEHRRFVLLRKILSLGSGNEGKREIVLNRRPELYRGKYRCILLWSPWKYRCGQRTVRMAVVACSQSQAVFARRRSKQKLKLLDIRAEKERKENARDGDRFNSCQAIYSQFGLSIHQNDHQARRRFVEWAQNEIPVVPDFHKRILFSDEAHFWLNGYVNKQNCRIWSEANPQVYVETPLHPEKLTVWCALWAGGIIGPYFFKNDESDNVTVNGDRYRAMITNFFIPELNNHDVQELWFQQDGATCHTARATIDLLKDTFGDRLISRFGPVNWPPRSCDLTPLDYFLWGYVKSLVYADKPQTLDHLEDNIRRVIVDIRPQMLEKVIENWTSRLDYIRASRGSPMPEIIFKM
ncbi:putative DD41D transposase [Trichonephila clavipes]|nr:putative DD41D transposase [Trichonephila clavipes]